MAHGSDGKFRRVFDGRNRPGVLSYLVDDLETGRSYRFKVRALNYNGAGLFSNETVFTSCLPPQQILPPQYVSSTNSSLRVTWGAPAYLYGCPLINFKLYINDGQGGVPSTLVATLAPNVNFFNYTAF
jgi:hypothetical protein